MPLSSLATAWTSCSPFDRGVLERPGGDHERRYRVRRRHLNNFVPEIPVGITHRANELRRVARIQVVDGGDEWGELVELPHPRPR